MHEPADEELAARVVHRDEQAFRALYRRHTPAMYGVSMRLAGSRRDIADDAVQEAWLRAVRGLPQFRWRSSLRTWLIGITIRCSLELTRAALTITDIHDNALVSDARTPPIDLEQAIASLADGYRQILVLHDIEGYTHAEIAELLGIDEGTSKSQLSRARVAVRKWFARSPEDCSHESRTT